MYLAYVDESGDPGSQPGKGSPYFVLSALVVNASHWGELVRHLFRIRKTIKAEFNIGMRDEIHAGEFISRDPKLRRSDGKPISRWERLCVIRQVAEHIGKFEHVHIVNVVLDKRGFAETTPIFDMAWEQLLLAIESLFIGSGHDHPALPLNGKCVLFCDDTNGDQLRRVFRKACPVNPLPLPDYTGELGDAYPVSVVLEDPSLRDSRHSYLIQAADLVAYLLYQSLVPNSFFRSKGATRYVDLLTKRIVRTAEIACQD